MKSSVIAMVLGIATGLAPLTADAHPSVLGKPKASVSKAEPGPTEVDKQIKLSPDGIKFGMTLEEISSLYSDVFDKEYLPLYKRVEPGPRMSELDAEIADKKQLLKRHKLELGSLPCGLDTTPLAGEYTYNNGESLSHLKLHSGVHRYFFFFGDHLWKIVDIHKLGKKGRLGEDFDGAVATLTKQFGKPPRARKADPSAGRTTDQDDWAGKATIVRLSDYGFDSAAIIYIDRQIGEHLDRYRTNKPAKEAMDSAVRDATKANGGKPVDKNKDVDAAYLRKKRH